MTLYHAQSGGFKGGATPATFDGGATCTLNVHARRIIGMIVQHALSAVTSAEGTGAIIRLNSPSNNINNAYFAAGFIMSGGTAAQANTKAVPIDRIALDIPVNPNTTVSVDVTTWGGATQTGTNDCMVDLIYTDDSTPQDIIQQFWNSCSNVPCKGGIFAYSANQKTTTRTALTGGTLFTVPAQATEICGAVAAMVIDTAPTDAEQGNAYIDIEGLPVVDQKFLTNSITPGFGTDTDELTPAPYVRQPAHIHLGGVALALTAYVNLDEALTGGAAVMINLLWR